MLFLPIQSVSQLMQNAAKQSNKYKCRKLEQITRDRSSGWWRALRYGEVVTRLQGCKVIRIQGYKDTRLQGYKVTRLQGYKDTRLQGNTRKSTVRALSAPSMWRSITRRTLTTEHHTAHADNRASQGARWQQSVTRRTLATPLKIEVIF